MTKKIDRTIFGYRMKNTTTLTIRVTVMFLLTFILGMFCGPSSCGMTENNKNPRIYFLDTITRIYPETRGPELYEKPAFLSDNIMEDRFSEEHENCFK